MYPHFGEVVHPHLEAREESLQDSHAAEFGRDAWKKRTMTIEPKTYAIYRRGGKTPSLVTASSLREAKDFAVPLTMLFFPGHSLEGLRVTRFRGNPRRAGLTRGFILALLNAMRQ